MRNSTKQFRSLIPAADLPEGRAAFLLSGGAKAVVAAANRHSGWQGKALVPLCAMSVACAFFVLGWTAALACSLSILVSVAIYSLAQDSLKSQLRAGKHFESSENAFRFIGEQILTSMRTAVLELSKNRFRLREVTLSATQRVIARLSGLVHVALSTRVLPTPLPLR